MSGKASAAELSRAGCRYLGTPYGTLDCQKFWEKVLADCGVSMDLGGSNSWYRYMMDHGWVGTPEECRAEFGRIPPGATLFIREEVSASTPEKFRHDGIGDITHMGIYTNLSGAEMVAEAIRQGNPNAGGSNYGDGAIHSSSSRGGVCTSKFDGKTIPHGGWNRVGLFLDRVDYDGTEPTPGPGPSPDPEPAPEPEREIARVWSENGKAVNTRKGPDESYGQSKAGRISVGSLVEILERKTNKQGEEWCRISWQDQKKAVWYCWMKACFLIPEKGEDPDEGSETQLYTVMIPYLTEYQAESLIRQYTGAWMTPDNGRAG